MRIVIGGDSAGTLNPVARRLIRAGHVVDEVSDCIGLEEAARFASDALILHATSAGPDLLRLVAALRAKNPQVTIIVVTAADQAALCALLDAGADDIVRSPADPRLLIARVTALIRRGWGHATPELRAGQLALHIGRWECTVDGRVIPLTEMEYRLVEALALRRGQPVPRSLLLELLYTHGSEPMPKSIDLFVHNVRRKLAGAGQPGCLETWGQGFVLRDLDQSRLALAS